MSDLLNLYKGGRILNKVTVQRELNRYLGRTFKNETERDLYYYKTLSNHLAKSLNLKKQQAKSHKIDDVLDKIDDRRAERLVKNETLTNNRKAFSTINIELNTKTMLKDMPDEEEAEITEKEYTSWQEKDGDDYEDLTQLPSADSNFDSLKSRLRKIVTKKLGEIDKQRKSVKVALVMAFKVFKVVTHDDKGELKFVYHQKELYARTRAKQLLRGSFAEDISEILDDLEEAIDIQATHVVGSGWRIKQFQSLKIEIYKTKPARGSSYIPTPARYSNAKCGLINIQNNDQECFKWCMKYHQSEKKKHDDRVTVLSKLEDKYNYEGLKYPVGYDDITKFENNNGVCIFVYSINEDEEIVKERSGNIKYYNKDLVYLLRIESANHSHFVYI